MKSLEISCEVLHCEQAPASEHPRRILLLTIVAYLLQAVGQAMDKGIDLVVCDTSGRLHTNIGLMEELGKCRRSLNKRLPGAPHEALLVLDGTTGALGLKSGAAVEHGPAVLRIVLLPERTGKQGMQQCCCMGVCELAGCCDANVLACSGRRPEHAEPGAGVQ